MIDPAQMELHAYANAVNAVLGRYGATATLAGDDWRAWAIAVTSSPLVDARAVPYPRVFADWRDWGRALGLVLGGLDE